MKVLFVDDEEVCQKAFKNMATSLSIEVDVAVDGEEAVEFAKKETPYDLILMDMYMPKLNGTQACEAIRGLGHGSSYKIILVSGMDNLDDEEVKKWGFDGFVKKPLGKSSFKEVMEKYK